MLHAGRVATCSGSRSTSSRPPTSAPPRGCGSATTNPPAGWSSTARRPRTGRARPGSVRARGTSPTSTSTRCTRMSPVGCPGPTGASTCPPAATRRCCRRARWPTCSSTSTGPRWPATRTTAGRSSAHQEEVRVSARTLTRVPVRMWSDPAAEGLECAPVVLAAASGASQSVFDNGLPIVSTDWINEGELTGLIQTRHSAALTGLPVTPGVDNLLFASPDASRNLDQMVAATARGLLLTCLWYIRSRRPADAAAHRPDPRRRLPGRGRRGRRRRSTTSGSTRARSTSWPG